MVWCRSARTLLHKIANEVLVRIRFRVSLTLSYGAVYVTYTSTPDHWKYDRIRIRLSVVMVRVATLWAR